MDAFAMQVQLRSAVQRLTKSGLRAVPAGPGIPVSSACASVELRPDRMPPRTNGNDRRHPANPRERPRKPDTFQCAFSSVRMYGAQREHPNTPTGFANSSRHSFGRWVSGVSFEFRNVCASRLARTVRLSRGRQPNSATPGQFQVRAEQYRLAVPRTKNLLVDLHHVEYTLLIHRLGRLGSALVHQVRAVDRLLGPERVEQKPSAGNSGGKVPIGSGVFNESSAKSACVNRCCRRRVPNTYTGSLP